MYEETYYLLFESAYSSIDICIYARIACINSRKHQSRQKYKINEWIRTRVSRPRGAYTSHQVYGTASSSPSRKASLIRTIITALSVKLWGMGELFPQSYSNVLGLDSPATSKLVNND